LTPTVSVLLAAVALAGQAALPPPTGGEDRERAVAALHRRAETVVPGTPDARKLAESFGIIGRLFLSEGETGRAIELLGEAYGLDEENGLTLAELTLAYVRAGDFDSARFYLQRAEPRATRAPPEIYGVLGEVYDAFHRLEDAVTAWSEFVRFGGQDPKLLARLARARDELAVTRGQRSIRLEHFVVFADPGVSDGVARLAGNALEAAYREQAAFLGARLLRPQVAVLYGGRAWFSLASVPDWVSGLYDGKIRVSVEADVPAALSGVLAHELAHALLRLSTHERAPAWLHEGLAQWLEGRRIPRRQIRSAAGARPAESLAELDARFHQTLDRAAAGASYAQSLAIVEYLAVFRGERALACLVAALGEGASFPEALRAETGLTAEELSSGWRTWAGY
jgi:tetratricopeptide (TPR) repeat protein